MIKLLVCLFALAVAIEHARLTLLLAVVVAAGTLTAVRYLHRERTVHVLNGWTSSRFQAARACRAAWA